MNKKPKRRWFRFSLRALLVFVTVACAGFGWLGYKVRVKQREREAIEAIKMSGAAIFYDYEVDANGQIIMSYSPTPPGPAWLRRLLGEDFFANVVWAMSKEGDARDSDLRYLQEFPHLRWLHVTGKQFTDGGLVHVQRLTQLEELILSDTQVTDVGLVHLHGLTKLKELYLDYSQVTDAGLADLYELTQLGELYLRETPVTDAGCHKLQKALPNLKIER